jgi:hypothetical protein
MRSAGIAPQAEANESDDDEDENDGGAWSDDDEARQRASRTRRTRAPRGAAQERRARPRVPSAPCVESTSHGAARVSSVGGELLKRVEAACRSSSFRPSRCTPTSSRIDFQRAVLKAGVFEACTAVIEDESSDRVALLYALGLLKRLTSKNGAISSVKFSQAILRRLCAEAQPDCDDPRIRSFAITLLAAMENKKQLEELGFYEDCIKFCSPGHAANSPLVENALAIALVNFSLEVPRQRRILDTITMARLTAWAKSLEPDLKTCAAAFVSNLVANEDVKLQIIHDGGLTILIKLMAAPGTPGYKEHAARGLANLALHDEAHLPMLERGVLQILSRIVLEEPPSSVQTLRSALRCLGLMSVSDRAGPAIGEYMVRQRDFANRINDIAASDNEELAKHAEKTLQNVALHAKGKSIKKKRTAELVEQLLQRRPSLDDLGSWNIDKEQVAGSTSTAAFSSPLNPQKAAAPAPTATAAAAAAASGTKSPRLQDSKESTKESESDEESDDERNDEPIGDKTTIRLDTGERRDSFGDLAMRHKSASKTAAKAKSPLSPRDKSPLSPRSTAAADGDNEADEDDDGLIGGGKKLIKKVTRRNKTVHV